MNIPPALSAASMVIFLGLAPDSGRHFLLRATAKIALSAKPYGVTLS